MTHHLHSGGVFGFGFYFGRLGSCGLHLLLLPFGEHLCGLTFHGLIRGILLHKQIIDIIIYSGIGIILHSNTLFTQELHNGGERHVDILCYFTDFSFRHI